MRKLTLFAIMALLAVFAFGQSMLNRERMSKSAKQMHVYSPSKDILTMSETDLKVMSNRRSSSYAFHSIPLQTLSTKVPLSNDGIIEEQPEGTLKAFIREGKCYFSEDFINYDQFDCSGYVEVVYAPDGKTVYFKEFLSALAGLGGWVKGTLSDEGRKIHIPTGQNLAYAKDGKGFMQLSRVVYNTSRKTFEKDKNATEITLTVNNGKKISIDNTDEHHIVGITFDSDNSWAGFGDFGVNFNLFEDQLVTPPTGLTKNSFVLNGYDSNGAPIAQGVSMMKNGKDVYLQGLAASYNSQAWVKGTTEGNKITIPSGQYLGLFNGSYLLYFISGRMNNAGDVTVKDLVFTYDEKKQVYTTDESIILGDQKETSRCYDIFSNLVLTKGLDISFSTDVIKEQPQGVVKVFQRRGKAYTIDRGVVFTSFQDGNLMEITYDPDGKTVYLKNPISQVYADSWVKGTLNGNKLIVPAFQCVFYNTEENSGGILAKLDLKQVVDPETGDRYKTFEPDTKYKNFTYTIDSQTGTITLDDLTDANSICGLIMSDNFKWPGYGDYGTAYLPSTEEFKIMPKDIKTEEWSFSYNNGLEDQARLVNVGIQGDKMYIDQISEHDPTAVIEGTIKDGKVTFESGQYLGRGMGIFLYYTAALCSYKDVVDGDIAYKEVHYKSMPRLVFNYDKEHKILTVPENHTLLMHCGNNIPQDADLMNYYVQSINPKFEYYVESAAQPMDPQVVNYDESTWDASGYSAVQLNIPLKDVNNKFVKPENMAYQLFIKVGEDVEPYILYTDEYDQLEKDMEVIPYTFTEGKDIMAAGENITLRQTGFDDIGVQSINYSGGKEIRSNVVWFKGPIDAIDRVEEGEKSIKEIIYYSIDGIRQSKPLPGINLMKEIYEDGTVKTKKIFKKAL